jgi:hypothetical protein
VRLREVKSKMMEVVYNSLDQIVCRAGMNMYFSSPTVPVSYRIFSRQAVLVQSTVISSEPSKAISNKETKNRQHASVNSEKITYLFRPSSNSVRKRTSVSIRAMLKVPTGV